ncbi:MAG: tetratricopeptide repeat protein [Rhodospirillales bacterium]|nr:tetratricopeptide repeat protein [Rhodospirillales bacterium]
MKRVGVFLAALACVIALPAGAQKIDPKREYAACLDLARSDPPIGFDRAIAWEGLGGGFAAKHCTAVALIGLGKHREAAHRLELLANEAKVEPATRAEMLGQAGQALTLSGDLERALSAQNAAIKLDPGNADLVVDRAVTLFGMGDYRGAEFDLDRAIQLAPDKPDSYAFRSAARRHQDKNGPALADAEKALALTQGRHQEALLERGILRRLAGDAGGARKDWMAILALSPEGPTADQARRNIELLDVKNP